MIYLLERRGHLPSRVVVTYRGATVRVFHQPLRIGAAWYENARLVDCLPTEAREGVDWITARGRTLPEAFKPIAAYLRGEE